MTDAPDILRSRLRYPCGRPADGEVVWRCEARSYSVVLDAEAELYGSSSPVLEMSWYPIQRRTPKGAWVQGKFIRFTAKRRWASPTEEDALMDFRARRRVQVSILSNRLARAKAELVLAEIATAGNDTAPGDDPLVRSRKSIPHRHRHCGDGRKRSQR